MNEIVTKCGCRIFEDVIVYCDKHSGRMSYIWKRAAKKWYSGDGCTQRYDEWLTIARALREDTEANVTRLRGLLEEFEWLRMGEFGLYLCPKCKAKKNNGHRFDCDLAAELKNAT